MGERRANGGGDVLRDGARAVFGVLGALRDVVGETVGDLIDPGAERASGGSAGPAGPPHSTETPGSPAAPPEPTTSRSLREVPVEGALPLFRHPDWTDRFPWLIQGVTGRGVDGRFDLGMSNGSPIGEALERWRRLQATLDVRAVVHSRQVHGVEVLRHRGGEPGVLVSDGFDGHITDRTDLALTVSVADCVPIYLVDPEQRQIALLHGGWRGVAAGILEAGLAALARMGSRPRDLWMHTGPSICGRCYEVGPEVHEALGRPRPATNTTIDLREVLTERARAAGLRDGRVSRSAHCTRCGDSPFFSHRGGEAGRQMAYLGLRAG